MDEDLKIVLTTQLEADPDASARRIAAQLPDIEKKINALSKGLKLQVEIDQKVIDAQLQKTAQKIDSKLKALGNSRQLSFSKIFVGAGDSADQLSKTISSVVDEFGRIVTTTHSYNLETKEIENTVEKTTANYEKQRKEIERAAQIAAKDNASRIQFLTRQETLLKNIYGNFTGSTSTKPITNEKHLNDLNNGYSKLLSTIQSLMVVDGKLSTEQRAAIQSQIADLNRLAKAYQNVEYSATDLRAKRVTDSVAKFRTDLAGYASQLKMSDNYTTEFKNRITELYAGLNKITNAEGLHNWQNAFAKLKSDVRLFNKEVKLGVKDFVLAEKIKKASADLEALGKKWSALFNNKGLADNYRALSEQLSKITNADDFSKWRASYAAFQAEVKKTGLAFKSFGGQIKDVGKRILEIALGFGSIYQAVNLLRNSIQAVIDLDTAMIDLRKVTTGTEEQYRDFYNTANETAKALNATTEAVIQQSANWARLGYSLKESSELAKNSMIFAAISPGMDQQSAMDGLVSVIKAYRLELDNVMDTMSEINEVGNNFALNNLDIVEALRRSSSAMSAANNSFEETVALITAATEITRDPSSVGNGLKTGLSLYIEICA